MTQIVIGTAGHIDHGKTALVKALTGINTDQLKEEKSRGITIDLGFAHLNEKITIIDVPGHEKFIRNMVSGVSTINIALLVIAADDGVMPQTREHLQILLLLGIPHCVIALTKTDMINDPDWVDLVEMDIKDLLESTHYKSAPIIRTSVSPESGITELRQLILNEAEKVKLTLDRGFFRLPVDRMFIKTGFGVVVTGTVISGSLSVGDEIDCLPIGKHCKVRSIQSHGENVQSVEMGDRAAINVVGIEKDEVGRGSELIETGRIKPTTIIIAHIQLIKGIRWELKSKQRVRIHLGTSEVLGRVSIAQKRIKSGESGNVCIRLENPLVTAMDDRFVMRSYSPMETIGGGVILDTNPKGNWKEIRHWMTDLSLKKSKRYLQFIERFWKQPKSEEEWRKIFHCSTQELQELFSDKNLGVNNKMVIDLKKLNHAQKILVKRIEKYHKDVPYRKSISNDFLQKELKFSGEFLNVVITQCIEKNTIRKIDGGFALKNHKILLSLDDQRKADLISEYLNQCLFEPQSLLTIQDKIQLKPDSVLELLHVLKGQGKSIELSNGLWLSNPNFDKLKEKLNVYFSSRDSLSVSEFKSLTHLTRKTAIPFLEFLDKNRFTDREGNVRVKGEML